MSEYIVKRGDSLSVIAERELGNAYRWPDIYAANKATMDAEFARAYPTLRRYNRSAHHIHQAADFVRPGQVLRLP